MSIILFGFLFIAIIIFKLIIVWGGRNMTSFQIVKGGYR